MKEDMSHRFQRLLGLLAEIKDSPGQTTLQLSEKFGTSKRNLFRDIKLLQESGFAIRNEEGYHLDSEPPAFLGTTPSQGLQPWNVDGAGAVELVIRVESGLAQTLRAEPLHPSQSIKGNVVTLKVSGPDRVVDWLMSVQGAELLEPSWLRGSLHRRAQALAQTYR